MMLMAGMLHASVMLTCSRMCGGAVRPTAPHLLQVTFVPGKAGCAASNGGGNRHLMAISDPLDVDAATVPAATRPSNPVAAPQLPKGSAAAAACGPSSSVAKRVGFRVLEVCLCPSQQSAQLVLAVTVLAYTF
jgi:hypothetical protein